MNLSIILVTFVWKNMFCIFRFMEFLFVNYKLLQLNRLHRFVNAIHSYFSLSLAPSNHENFNMYFSFLWQSFH